MYSWAVATEKSTN